MSQHDLSISNQTFPNTRTDLNNALQALGTLQSGATAPSTTYANMLWYDTTNKYVKMRNEADDAWISLFYVDQTNDRINIESLIHTLDGSVSAPSISFEDDTNTGIYRKAADTIALTAGGTEALSATASGVTMTAATVTTATITTGNITTVDLGNWTITESSGTLYFATGGTNKMKLEADGTLTTVGDVVAYGTI